MAIAQSAHDAIIQPVWGQSGPRTRGRLEQRDGRTTGGPTESGSRQPETSYRRLHGAERNASTSARVGVFSTGCTRVSR